MTQAVNGRNILKASGGLKTNHALVRRECDPITYEFERETRLSFRHLERVPLRTPYPDVVSMVRRMVRSLPEQSRELVMDATGMGGSVVDLLKRANLHAR
jgi:hypothetical protein